MVESMVALFTLFLVFGPFPINMYLAAKRERSVLLFLFFTIFLSWIITLILACISKPIPTQYTHFQCDSCGEWYHNKYKNNRFCRHCGHDFPVFTFN